MKSLLSILLSLFLIITSSGAYAMTLLPEAGPSEIETEGIVQYQMSIINVDQIEQAQTFTIGLYNQNTYPADQIQKLMPGDAIVVNDLTIDIAEIRQSNDGIFELIPKGDDASYIVLIPTESGSYIILVDDWSPCTFIAEMNVSLPLPEGFIYLYGNEETLLTAEDFIRELTNGNGAWMNQYNSTITLADCIPMLITHSGYPEGPTN